MCFLLSFLDNLNKVSWTPGRVSGRVDASLGGDGDMVDICLGILSSFNFEDSADLFYLFEHFKMGLRHCQLDEDLLWWLFQGNATRNRRPHESYPRMPDTKRI